MNTSRRALLQAMGLGAAAMMIPGCKPKEETAERLPNVVIIFTDDQGYGDVGCYGAEGFTTPNMDLLAKEGVKFTDFHVSEAVCSASRSSLLTGCYAQRISIRGAMGPWNKDGINPKEETIAELLKKKGYTTGIFGKWHLGHHKEYLPLAHGFDEYFGLPYSNDMWAVGYDGDPESAGDKSWYPPLPLIEGDETIEIVATLEDQARLTTRYTEKAVDFVNRHKEKPFFLYLAHSMPHVPLGVSEKFKGKSEQGMYGDVIMEIDWSIGEVMKALRENGLDNDTLVIFTSDNGPWINYGNHAGSQGVLREAKGASWEGGTRVPCIMRWPGQIKADTTCHELAATIDILPTLSELTGAPMSGNRIDGTSILPLIRGETDESPRDEYIYYYIGNLCAVRQGKWKLYFPHKYRSYRDVEPGMDGWPGPYDFKKTGLELYDLENDISETTDVAAEHPDVVARLEQLGEKYRQELGDGLHKLKGEEVRPTGPPVEVEEEKGE